MHTEISATVLKLGTVMAAGDDALHHRIDAHDERLDDIEHKSVEQETINKNTAKDMAEMREHLNILQRRLGVAEAGDSTHIKAMVDNDSFDRAIDPTFLWIEGGGGAIYAKDQCMAVIKPWLDAAKISPDQYTVPGKPTARKFKLQFKGTGGLAEQLTARAFKNLRVDDEWRPMDALDTDGKTIKLFVNPDKSPKQRRTEIATRDLARIITKETGVLVYPNKREGRVQYNFMSLAKIEFKSEDEEPIVYWSTKNLPKFPHVFDKAHIKQMLVGGSTRRSDEPELWEV